MENLLFGNGYGYVLVNGIYHPTKVEGAADKGLFEHKLKDACGLDGCIEFMVYTYAYLKEQVPHRAKALLNKYDPCHVGLTLQNIRDYCKFAKVFFNNAIPYLFEETGSIVTVHYLHPYTGEVSSKSFELKEDDGSFNQELWLHLILLTKVSFDHLIKVNNNQNPLFFPFFTYRKNELSLDNQGLRNAYEDLCKINGVDSFIAYKHLVDFYKFVVTPCALEHFTEINKGEINWNVLLSDTSLPHTSQNVSNMVTS